MDVTVYTTIEGSATCRGCFTYKTPATWISVSAGDAYTCGLTSDGAANCWGRTNTTGAFTSRLTPAAVTGGLTFASLVTGSNHSCGLASGGFAWCWGIAFTPVAVAGGLAFANLTAGDGPVAGHTCGLTNGGAAYCWGDNGNGQLGDGSTTDRTGPVAVTGGLTFTSLAAGDRNTCGVTGTGAAYCWGSMHGGPNSTTPVAVTGGLTFASLTAGPAHTCGLTSGGTAYCWGVNGNGQLGDGTHGNTTVTSPVAVVGGLTFASMAAGFVRTCGVTNAGAAYCWGAGFAGQNVTAPLAVSGGHTFASLTVGDAHVCGVTSTGAAYCWGNNNFGQLGDGSYTDRTLPVLVASP